VTNQIDVIVRDALARGLVDVTLLDAEKSGHPWPVVVLTAVGALLAALPICGLFALLFVSSSRGTELYVLGPVVLGCTAAMLRVRKLPLFLEYLGVCLLGSGLFMVWVPRGAHNDDAICAVAALAVSLAVRQAWIRTLCCALAVFMLDRALLAVDTATSLAQLIIWNRCYLLVGVWLAGHALLRSAERHGKYNIASGVESVLIGLGVVNVLMLAYQSGQSFLISQILPDHNWLSLGGHDVWFGYAPPFLSAGAALAAGVWLVTLKRFDGRLLGVCIPVFVLVSWFTTSLGALLLMAAACLVWGRPQLAKLTGLAGLWTIGSLYYWLGWPLLYKSVLLFSAAGVLLFASAWRERRIAGKAECDSDLQSDRRRCTKAGLIAPAVAALLIVNVGIYQKEQIIRQGQSIFVELAPVDPRSLMQGDYMALNFALSGDLDANLDSGDIEAPYFAVAQRGENSVATITHIHDKRSPLKDNEILIEVTRQRERFALPANAWHFEEGDGERWSKAKYGELRVDGHGQAVLVGLRDASLEKL